MTGKVALITGATRGLGLAFARALAEEGCNLALTARDAPDLEKVAHQLAKTGVRAFPYACDVRDPVAVQSLCVAVEGRFHRVDILINNAGIAHENCPIEKLDFETWMEVIGTNLHGMFLVSKCALPMMRRGSAIVNNLSIAAKRVFPGSSAYNASKHAALGFTNTLREELRPKGIRVIALIPGATDTDIWKTLWPEAPRKKMMKPETVARAMVDALCTSPEATAEELTILPSAGTL